MLIFLQKKVNLFCTCPMKRKHTSYELAGSSWRHIATGVDVEAVTSRLQHCQIRWSGIERETKVRTLTNH